jgi:hypothetical protein
VHDRWLRSQSFTLLLGVTVGEDVGVTAAVGVRER